MGFYCGRKYPIFKYCIYKFCCMKKCVAKEVEKNFVHGEEHLKELFSLFNMFERIYDLHKK